MTSCHTISPKLVTSNNSRTEHAFIRYPFSCLDLSESTTSWRKAVPDCTQCWTLICSSTERASAGLHGFSITCVFGTELAQGFLVLRFPNFSIYLPKDKQESVKYRHRLCGQQTYCRAPYSMKGEHTKHKGKELKMKREVKWIQQKSMKWRKSQEDFNSSY